MKKIQLSLYNILLSCCILLLVSCSKDDDTDKTTTFNIANLIGSWECIHDSGYEGSFTWEDHSDESCVGEIWIFNKDGSGSEIELIPSFHSFDFNWSYKTEELTIGFLGDLEAGDPPYIYKIVELTATSLIAEDSHNSNGHWFYQKLTFTKK